KGPVAGLHHLRFQADQVAVARYDGEVRHQRFQAGLGDADLAGQHIKTGDRPRVLGDTNAGRGVALRVDVEDQHLLADGGQRGTEIDGSGGLADATLLIGDGKDAERAGHGSNPSIWVADL